MRQWVNAGDGERKVWVVLVSEPETGGFDAKAEARRVAVEWLALGRRIEELELVEAQNTLVDLSGLLAGAYPPPRTCPQRLAQVATPTLLRGVEAA